MASIELVEKLVTQNNKLYKVIDDLETEKRILLNKCKLSSFVIGLGICGSLTAAIHTPLAKEYEIVGLLYFCVVFTSFIAGLFVYIKFKQLKKFEKLKHPILLELRSSKPILEALKAELSTRRAAE